MKTYKSNIKRLSLKVNKTDIPKAKIKLSKDAYEYALQFYEDDIDIYESFFLLTLNTANIVTSYVKISQGGVRGTIVDNALVAKYAIDVLASSVIIFHNHPSGNVNPSNSDINLTKDLKKGLMLFQIGLLDHLIISKDNYYSLTDNNLL
jgi:DNA repair protein RadC